jgi:hypothetical protein
MWFKMLLKERVREVRGMMTQNITSSFESSHMNNVIARTAKKKRREEKRREEKRDILVEDEGESLLPVRLFFLWITIIRIKRVWSAPVWLGLVAGTGCTLIHLVAHLMGGEVTYGGEGEHSAHKKGKAREEKRGKCARGCQERGLGIYIDRGFLHERNNGQICVREK